MSFFKLLKDMLFVLSKIINKKVKMEVERLLKQLAFIKEIDKIKYIQRKSKLFYSDRRENDAEHSWHLAMMVLILAEYSNDTIDVLKVLKMVLIHDIVEIDAGDIFLYDTKKNHNNTAEELKAAKRIFGMLPSAQAETYIKIWLEFEEGKTKEATFAKAIDRLQPILQNLVNNGGTWKEFDVPFSMVYEKSKSIDKGSTIIWKHVEALINTHFNI